MRRAFSLFIFVASLCLTSQAVQPPSLKAQAWEILHNGAQAKGTEERATAVRVLSLLRGQPEAVKMARAALDDPKPEVRAAGALSIGELRDRASISQLKKAIADNDGAVVLAAAHALLQMGDRSAYDVYYEILTGERHTGKGLIASQMDTLKDPKKMAVLGFQEGIGFIPFAGAGYGAVRMLMKDDSSPVRAAAAKVLAAAPGAESEDALVQAATMDKSEVVRVAALDAIAQRRRRALVSRIAPAMADSKDSVKYTAAAVVIKLSTPRPKPAPTLTASK